MSRPPTSLTPEGKKAGALLRSSGTRAPEAISEWEPPHLAVPTWAELKAKDEAAAIQYFQDFKEFVRWHSKNVQDFKASATSLIIAADERADAEAKRADAEAKRADAASEQVRDVRMRLDIEAKRADETVRGIRAQADENVREVRAEALETVRETRVQADENVREARAQAIETVRETRVQADENVREARAQAIETVREARAQAERIVQMAGTQAEQIVQMAGTQAIETVREARARADAESKRAEESVEYARKIEESLLIQVAASHAVVANRFVFETAVGRLAIKLNQGSRVWKTTEAYEAHVLPQLVDQAAARLTKRAEKYLKELEGDVAVPDVKVIVERLLGQYGLLSSEIHFPSSVPALANYKGLICGGRLPIRAAVGLVLKLARAQGVLKHDVTYVNESYNPLVTLRANQAGNESDDEGNEDDAED